MTKVIWIKISTLLQCICPNMMWAKTFAYSLNCLPAIKGRNVFVLAHGGVFLTWSGRVRVLWGIRRHPNTFNKPISSTEILLFPSLPTFTFLTAGNLIGVKCGRTYSQGVFRLGHCYYLSVIGADLYSGGGPLALLIARRVTHAAYQQTTDRGGEPTERNSPLLSVSLRARKLKGPFFPSAARRKYTERD